MGFKGMMDTTVTRAQLAEAVYQEVGLSRNDSAQLVDEILEEVSQALIKGGSVKLSSFGSFQVRAKGKRIGRNPKTGEEVPILPRRVLVFRASHVLKNRINAVSRGSAPRTPGPVRRCRAFGLPSRGSRGAANRRRPFARSAKSRKSSTCP